MIDPDEFRARLLDVLPKGMHEKIDEILTIAEELGETELTDSYEVAGAHVATQHIEYFNGTVHLDVSGNLVGVDFGEETVAV